MKTVSKNSSFAGKDDVDVTKEDQKYINEFSRLHSKNKLIDVEIKKIKDVQESLDECLSTIDECFGENIKLNIGESFIETTEDEAREYVETQKKKFLNQKNELISKYEINRKRLDDLKIILYTKFGKSIHLEED